MKPHNQSLFVILAVFTIFSLQPLTVTAQGTAFTYQGRLNSGNSPANGSYDLAFALYTTNVTGSAISGPVTNSAVIVTNGLFTTLVDFKNAFTGTSNWLEIAVSTNGANTFTTLAPRQQITPTPYALFANTASNVSGTITAAQLPPNVITNGASGFTLNGAGVTNLNPANLTGPVPGALPWQLVSGTSQQAQPNEGYLLMNNSLVTVTLPASPNAGDVVRVTGEGTNGWKIAQNAGQFVATGNLPANIGAVWMPRDGSRGWHSVASSLDGTKLVAVVAGGQIYTSVDSGVSWTAQAGAGSRSWYSVASSGDGTKLVAVVNSGQIYTSTDSGVTWLARDSSRGWDSVASSTDGTKLVATVGGGQIYTSTDAGTNWTARASSSGWQGVASSSDGTKLVAVIDGGQIYTSIDSGVTWAVRGSSLFWESVASSADGTKLVAVAFNAQIYTSIDSGVTWTARATFQNWQGVASSSDGTKLVAVVPSGSIFTSANSGVTWTAQTGAGSRNWWSVASSTDGTKLVVVINGGQIYTSVPSSVASTTTGTAGYLIGNQNAAIELQSVGSGQFVPISFVGLIQAL